jgi:hypothetical protein
MHEGPVALRSLSGELGRLGRSSGSWEERQARLLRRVASQYTLVSTTDPDDRLARKGAGQGAPVVFHGGALTYRNDGPIEMR